jgi:signal transduction histidine kinase
MQAGGPARFVRRLGCLAGCAILAPLGIVIALVWLLLGAAGVVGSVTALSVAAAIALALWAVVAAAVVIGLRRLAPPVGALVDAARRVESGDYSARVPVHGPGQVRSLARAFNAMSERLEADEARRSSVLADIAHELRTPLTVIRSQAEAIADGVHPADEEHIAPIVSATQTLESLADDLRTLTLVEAGGLHLDREPLDVGVLVNETVDSFRAEADFLGVRLSARVPEEPLVVDADPVRLRRILANLIANALTHAHRGGSVQVAVTAMSGEVELSVTDDGDGIPEDLLPRIFDRFVKGPGSTGSGLGLAIVRDLVEAHRGAVGVDSQPGRGATFRVTLPLAGA